MRKRVADMTPEELERVRKYGHNVKCQLWAKFGSVLI